MKPQIFYNLEQIQNLLRSGQYGKKNQKVGYCIAQRKVVVDHMNRKVMKQRLASGLNQIQTFNILNNQFINVYEHGKKFGKWETQYRKNNEYDFKKCKHYTKLPKWQWFI
ncbi:unnamed protein product [Paramecium primaurelia]|uniref:Uncharacterized protein n=1 Tax=Paramecium primaurelia TaxID=5886 RepID=A0A8S1NZC9_PARPR|nr:unnamed protein product [Paramecium primaurelia]